MNNIIKTFALALFAGSVLTSCELDLLPLNDVVLENYWTNKGDVENVLNSCYYGLEEASNIERMIVWGEVRSDNVEAGPGIGNSLRHLIKGNLKQTNDLCTWSSFYNVINRCNTLLYYAPQVSEKDPNLTPSDLNAISAEARGLRALCYFYLIRTFKDVPFTFEASIDDTQYYLRGASKHEVILDSLIEDIELCKNQAVNRYYNDKMNSGRITRDFLYSLLADMYLWRASDANLSAGEQRTFYKKAIECADWVIENKIKFLNNEKNVSIKANLDNFVYNNYGYPLLAERSLSGNSLVPSAYNAIFGEGNSFESIFELTYDQNTSALKNTSVFRMYGGVNSGVMNNPQLYASQAMQSSEITGKSFNNDGGLFSVTTDYRSLYSYRYSENGNYNILKYVVRQFNGENDFGTANTSTWKVPTGGLASMLRESDQAHIGWIIYRLTDVMLMRAEAEIQLAGLDTKTIDWTGVTTTTSRQNGADLSTPEELYQDAFNLINAVYLRANPYAQTSTAYYPQLSNFTTFDSFVKLCENERRRELLFEGKRYYDLVRRARRDGNTSHLAEAVSSKFEGNAMRIKMSQMDFMYMPIFKNELDVNPYLHQNPVYSEDEDIVKN